MSDAHYRFAQAQDPARPPTDAVLRAQHIPHACAGDGCENHVEFHRGDSALCETCAATKRDAVDAAKVDGMREPRLAFSPFSQRAVIAARNFYKRAHRHPRY